MWKLWHRLFGLHFIAIEFGFSDEIRRIRFDMTGRPYVKLYGSFYWLLKRNDRDRAWEALTFDKKTWVESFERPKPHLAHSS